MTLCELANTYRRFGNPTASIYRVYTVSVHLSHLHRASAYVYVIWGYHSGTHQCYGLTIPYPADGGKMFLRNTSTHLLNYTVTSKTTAIFNIHSCDSLKPYVRININILWFSSKLQVETVVKRDEDTTKEAQQPSVTTMCRYWTVFIVRATRFDLSTNSHHQAKR
jgi:hypothetical protein